MKVTCPTCHAPIPSHDVNVGEGVAYCRGCDEAYPLSQLVSHQKQPPARAERPAETKVAFASVRGESLALSLPRGGPRSLGCFLVFFTLFWNGMTWFFLLGPHTEGPAAFRWFGTLFMVPFVLVGLAVLAVTLYVLFGRASLAMNREELLLRREVLGLRMQKRHPVGSITNVGQAQAYSQNEVPVMGVAIFLKTTEQPVVFGSSLSTEEKAWLAWEIYEFWQSVGGNASPD